MSQHQPNSFAPTRTTEEKIAASPELQAAVFRATTENRDRLLEDYRKLLEVYFKLKKNSPKPNEFQNAAFNPQNLDTIHTPTIKGPAEFASIHYDEFKTQLDVDPRLKGNTYVAKMRAYGTCQANDLFQRVAASTLEDMGLQASPLFSTLNRRVASPIEAVGMLKANDIFMSVSRHYGYQQNGRPSRPEALAEWNEAVHAKEIELRQELRALEKKQREVLPSFNPTSAACAASYGQL